MFNKVWSCSSQNTREHRRRQRNTSCSKTSTCWRSSCHMTESCTSAFNGPRGLIVVSFCKLIFSFLFICLLENAFYLLYDHQILAFTFLVQSSVSFRWLSLQVYRFTRHLHKSHESTFRKLRDLVDLQTFSLNKQTLRLFVVSVTPTLQSFLQWQVWTCPAPADLINHL